MKKYLIAIGIAAFSLVALGACSETPNTTSETVNVVGYENAVNEELDCEKQGQRDVDGRPIPQC